MNSTSRFEFIPSCVIPQVKDKYRLSGTEEVVELMNSATDAAAAIASGTLVTRSEAFNAQSGVRTVTFIIKALDVPLDQTFYRIDEFIAKDTGSPLTVKDSDGQPIRFVVTIAGPKSPATPPGGGGGPG